MLSQRPKQSDLEEKEQVKYKLNQRLSNKFRPEKQELLDRGILLSPETDNSNVQWVLESAKQRNVTNLNTKFVTRPSPQALLEKDILTMEDYKTINEPNTGKHSNVTANVNTNTNTNANAKINTNMNVSNNANSTTTSNNNNNNNNGSKRIIVRGRRRIKTAENNMINTNQNTKARSPSPMRLMAGLPNNSNTNEHASPISNTSTTERRRVG
ncbi:hypothetical protein RFI_28507 [Reticulomyxa filosa]|uniref:Uncharacterized protein n=1 Tax=Reticulomyxa filosa TaxID=46433 RepID=X6M610_RETFI|nr:hypothetical protein RFI_28507 [Reticulomyxa filosa]|eukprot:ETO08877.1 hypothetical protein RFI_28507 [Reticulomyxa filosa]